MVNPIHVLIALQSGFPQHLIDRLRAISPRFSIRQLTPEPGKSIADETWQNVEVLYTLHHIPQPEQAPNLRWIQFHSAGIDQVLSHPIFDKVLVTTTSGIHAPNMAEYVLMMMLAWSHRLRGILEYQKHAEWPKNRWDLFAPTELRYATIGIIGYGSIGREVARMSRAFGMRVLAMKRDIFDTLDVGWQLPGVGDEESSSVDRLYAPDELRALLAESDYVVIAAPLTDQTRGMFGADELHRMKPNAVLINISRGPIIKEDALIEALREGAIAGAILDVFDQEPLPADNPLWTLPNVIISPHVSGFSHEYDERAMTLFAANLGRYLENDRLVNVVDPLRGY